MYLGQYLGQILIEMVVLLRILKIKRARSELQIS